MGKSKTTCGGCVFRDNCGWAKHDNGCPDYTAEIPAERILAILKSREEFIHAYKTDEGIRVISFGMNNVRWVEDCTEAFELVWGWVA